MSLAAVDASAGLQQQRGCNILTRGNLAKVQ
jgi:hypothetical protein